MVDILVREIDAAVKGKLYSVALVALLTLPDICGSMEYGETEPVRDRYIKWLETFGVLLWSSYQKKDVNFGPSDVYELRCRVLHQGEVGRKDPDRPPLKISVPDEDGYHVLWPYGSQEEDRQYAVALPGFSVLMLKTVRFWQTQRNGG